MLSVSIKICWCFTLDIHTGVQYSFGSASGSQPQSDQIQSRNLATTAVATTPTLLGYPDYYQAANDYVTMLA